MNHGVRDPAAQARFPARPGGCDVRTRAYRPDRRRDRARGGDLNPFNALVVVYQDELFALVVRMVPDRGAASDAVQEAFFSAYRNMAGFRGGSIKSWLSRIAINAAMDAQRLKNSVVCNPVELRFRHAAAAFRPQRAQKIISARQAADRCDREQRE